VRITLSEVVSTVHRNYAPRRDVRRERDSLERLAHETPLFPDGMLDQVERATTEPEEKLFMIEEFDRLLDNLPEDFRQIVFWKVDGLTNAKIAEMTGRTVRSVELKMQLIRKRLGQVPEPITTPCNRPTASPQEPAPLIRRHTDVSFPARVRQGKMYHLRVQIVPAEVVLPSGELSEIPKSHSHDATMTLKVPRPLRSKKVPPIRVAINLAAENLDIQGSPRAQIVVPLEGKSRPVNFRLRGEKVGPGRIMVDFNQGGRRVGSVDLYPEIIAAESRERTRPVPNEVVVDLSQGHGLPAPDLVLKVFEHRFADQAGRLQYIVSSTRGGLGDLPVLDGDLGTIELKTDIAAWVEHRLQSVGSLAHRDDLSEQEVSRVMAGVGYNLFDQLLPKGLQDLCWTIRGRGVRTILILSDEPHIPWELIKPYRENPSTGEFEEDEFWGQSYALTHWLRGRPPAQSFSFNRICALAPRAATATRGVESTARDMVSVTPLFASQAGEPGDISGCFTLSTNEELAVLRSLETSGSRFQLLPARCADLLKAFEVGEFDLLHLVAHGEFAASFAADASAVLMEDGVFRVAELSPKMAAALRRAAPLIFFNSCHSGRMGFSLTRLGSWGARFVHLGCGGFVGTLWPVTDQAAVTFAGAFYEQMSGGQPIGESMLRARQQVRERYPNDPTWLAYCCFADPLARIDLLVRKSLES
jgi:CHAT domain/Sigma-70, region 4